MPIVGVFPSNSFSVVRTQHSWPTTPNIVGCYTLGPFAHPVAFCWMLLCFVAQSLKPVKLLAPCKRAQHCWPTSPTLLDVTWCVRLHTLLHFVGCFCLLSRKVWNLSNFSYRANGRIIVGQPVPTLLRAYWQWSANGCNNSQQCWDLQYIEGRIQPISLCKQCVISVRGPNNIGRAV